VSARSRDQQRRFRRAVLSRPPPVRFRLSIRQHTSAYVSIRQHTSAYAVLSRPRPVRFRLGAEEGGRIRQHTSAYVSIRQHTSAYVSIRRDHAPSAFALERRREDKKKRGNTSAYVSIRQHTSVYVSIRQRIAALLPWSGGGRQPHARAHAARWTRAPPALGVQCHTPYVIRHTSYVIRHTSCVPMLDTSATCSRRAMSYAIRHTSYVIRHTSYVMRAHAGHERHLL
jgi:hypothetical protein